MVTWSTAQHRLDAAKAALALAPREDKPAVLRQQIAELAKIARDGWLSPAEIGDEMTSVAQAHGLPPDSVQQIISDALDDATLPIANGSDHEPEDMRPPAFSDEALALRFTECYGTELRYVAAWSRWLVWDGARWRFDETLQAFDMARRICRESAAACNQGRIASVIASAKTVAAVERSPRPTASTPPPSINGMPTRGCSIRRAELSICARWTPDRIDPTDYMTKITAVAPDAAFPIPIWRAFLARVTRRRHGSIAFMQRLAGYALTGSTSEHALVSSTALARTASRLPQHHRRRAGRLSPHSADRDLHCQQHRSASDRPRRAARCAPRHRRRDRGRPPVGREPRSRR